MSEKRLIRKYIKSIHLDDIFDGSSIVGAIDNLLGEYNQLLELPGDYVRFEYVTDFENSNELEIYSFREETDEEISSSNALTKSIHAQDYATYLELKKRFAGME
jgi:hypothetical protein